MQNQRFVTKELIEKGWSEDKKYCVEDDCKNKFLLRASSMEQYDRKKKEFGMMQRLETLGVPMCRPLEFGVCDEGVYSV